LRTSRARLVRAGDTERQRLERNLHDGAQLRLTWLAIDLRRAIRRIRDAPDEAATLLEDADVKLELAIAELRELARGIHPAVLTDLGLADAIRSLAVRSAIPIAVLEVPRARVDQSAEATAYYVFAEAVTNAQKYSGAASVAVRAVAVGHTLRIEVEDHGVGGATITGGAGLQGLRDRVEAAGGTFTVTSPPGRGTRIAATIPVPDVARAPERPPERSAPAPLPPRGASLLRRVWAPRSSR
jgi:signal transduction histidine kinase